MTLAMLERKWLLDLLVIVTASLLVVEIWDEIPQYLFAVYILLIPLFLGIASGLESPSRNLIPLLLTATSVVLLLGAQANRGLASTAFFMLVMLAGTTYLFGRGMTWGASVTGAWIRALLFVLVALLLGAMLYFAQ